MSTETALKQPKKILKRTPAKRDALRYPFWFGGSASCFAACVTHPLDLVKVTQVASTYKAVQLTHLGQTSNPTWGCAQNYDRNIRQRPQN
ncbi:hypothetical protein WAI453_005790 [Rhynchosporium graminicola]